MSVLTLSTSRAADLAVIFREGEHPKAGSTELHPTPRPLRCVPVQQQHSKRLVRMTFTLPGTPPATHYLEPVPARGHAPLPHDSDSPDRPRRTYPYAYTCYTLDEQLEQGVVGPVFAGTLQLQLLKTRHDVKPLHTAFVPVVAKIALHPPETALLLHEAAIYARVAHLQGSALPRVFSLSRSVSAGGAFTVLVLAYAGAAVPRGQIYALSTAQRASLYADLERLHAGGVLHGDLRAENIVVSAAGAPSLIDLSHACVHRCRGAAVCEELREARDFFGLGDGL
ncbi:hypothetical protein C8R46DRAFT_1075743 [Mycena filopes]|nr:hypothetical protein C8R46DRAFT_1075743 [Mycena filopes]